MRISTELKNRRAQSAARPRSTTPTAASEFRFQAGFTFGCCRLIGRGLAHIALVSQASPHSALFQRSSGSIEGTGRFAHPNEGVFRTPNLARYVFGGSKALTFVRFHSDVECIRIACFCRFCSRSADLSLQSQLKCAGGALKDCPCGGNWTIVPPRAV